MKIKRFLSAAMALTMIAAGLSGCGGSDSDSGSGGTGGGSGKKSGGAAQEITVWAPEEISELTQQKLSAWVDSSDWAGQYTITVSAMGEGDAATQMLTDVEAGADVYGFAQDQLARLVAAGALSAPGGVFLDNVNNNNDSGSIGAATLDGKVYAYPETSDNGFFLYYDKSVVSDPSTLEGILSDCSAAGKKFYMDIQSGWYNVAFFFATGAQCYYNYDTEGNVTDAVCDYSGVNGLTAFKAMNDMAQNPGFGQSPDGAASLFDPNGGTAGAIVSGTWDSATVKELLGDNFGAAKMPTFTVDGHTYQMSGFGGFKLVGVKPQTDSDKLTFCHAVADYLTSEDMQLARFEANGWGPSNKNAQQSDSVKSNEALSALAEQLQFCPAQGQYPNAYWTLTEAFGTDINSGKYKDASDADLTAALTELEAAIKDAK
ncbi:arabinogalactan oligomer / maltooligosaccharide transport system substrate-binding protein [Ruminococcus sp. YE71]|uniref:extracellular solute-binding protein n=1 Tax=unclassified Ruminococcus TaxID=2608920 RepID=UPI00088B9846|nr:MULTISPECIES: extracellular solute-binding protein [unclassified Ruminococcus]SDA12139.1 arabinogalactan oligomer / maltooligosaccharide transport system substrate-binding protein [Ruminococcus sp. YE78]SFW16390.1 arabinogalactan oligomer / maltooligosaccharide transport system substrate-binding protein [Ruminococcus sp. YE71]